MRHRHLFFALIRGVWASNQVYIITYDPARSLMKERETFLEDIEEEYDELREEYYAGLLDKKWSRTALALAVTIQLRRYRKHVRFGCSYVGC